MHPFYTMSNLRHADSGTPPRYMILQKIMLQENLLIFEREQRTLDGNFQTNDGNAKYAKARLPTFLDITSPSEHMISKNI